MNTAQLRLEYSVSSEFANRRQVETGIAMGRLAILAYQAHDESFAEKSQLGY